MDDTARSVDRESLDRESLDPESLDQESGDRESEGLRHLPLSLIDPNPYQPRTSFNEVALQELVASVLEHGILQPVIVRTHAQRYQLVSGERRFHAARRAGLATVPALVHDYDDLRVAEIAIVENVQREDISPLEAAEAYRRLMDEFRLTQDQVALRVGKSRPAVANTLRLLKLPAPIRESLARGDITEGHARSLLSVPDPEWQERVWRRIVEENLSVRDTEFLSRASEPEPVQPAGPAGAPAASPEPAASPPRRVSRETRRRKRQDPNLAAVEDRLRLMLGTRVRIKGTPEAGSISIDYYSPEDLQRLAALLGIL